MLFRSLYEQLKVRYERIETLLDIMQREGWVSRAGSSGWVLRRGAATLPVADVYRLFVFEPAQAVIADDAELGLLAKACCSRISAGAQLSVAYLFEAAAGAPNAGRAQGPD